MVRKASHLLGAALVLLVVLAGWGWARSSAGRSGDRPPNIVFITVDTLRADRMSGYGYERSTSPNIDGLLARGVTFTDARVVEPLTNPSLTSMLTSLYPHEHGASRNGLRLHTDLDSLPKQLTRHHGYRTAAFVANWTLRDKLSGLGEHFGRYEEVLTKRRWFGILRSEATATDVSDRAIDWLEEAGKGPYLLWAHYTEPHAPYLRQEDFLAQLGLPAKGKLSKSDRYDSEIAFVDHEIGRLLEALEEWSEPRRTLIVFVADHGESLGEHGYWGHGRNLHEPGLKVPMGVVWAGRIAPGRISAPAVNIDLAPTVLTLLGGKAPEGFRGFDWTPVLDGQAAAPTTRVTRFQAHKGAVISKHTSDLARRAGLIAVGHLRSGEKEIFDIDDNHTLRYRLHGDPDEAVNLARDSGPSEALTSWMRDVLTGLRDLDRAMPEPLDAESAEQLRSLGYVD